MRLWLFHPVIFYPLAAFVAVIVIGLSIRPQAWPRPAAPVVGQVQNGVLLLTGAAFNSPDKGSGQAMTVTRDYWGNPQSLHVAAMPNAPAPAANETGVRILLSPESAAVLANKPITVDLTYRPQPINTAPRFAVSLQGGGPAQWVVQPIAPQAGTLRFQLPAGGAANAIGLRALSDAQDQAYGIEIVRIAAYPSVLQAPALPPPPPEQVTEPSPPD